MKLKAFKIHETISEEKIRKLKFEWDLSGIEYDGVNDEKNRLVESVKENTNRILVIEKSIEELITKLQDLKANIINLDNDLNSSQTTSFFIYL